jgi:DNA-binding beta-propeller fold protein YncE
LQTIDAGGGPEFAVADGHGIVYNNIEDKNKLNVIDSKSLSVIKSYALSPCGGPPGLAMDTISQRLFTVCRENKGMSVIDAVFGKIIATLSIGTGVDAVAFDAELKLIFCSNGDGTTSIFRQQSPNSYTMVQTLATLPRAKTLTLDPATHKIYLSAVDFQSGTKTQIPGSFKVLVFKPAN